jgi:site-specific DNA recombinase
MKAVLYAAKSTEDAKGSIPDQLTDGRKLAADRGFEVVAEFQDEAKSAYHGDRGPDLAKALAECQRLSAEHGSCALIVQRSDRLARGDGKQARSLVEIVLWAIKHDVELHSVMDPEILAGGDFALVMGAIGHMKGHGESKVKSESVSRGMRRKAGRGEFVGHPPYGYRHRDRQTGKPTGPLVVVLVQAEVVRSVFSGYASGQGQRAIVRALNDAGTPTATGGVRWQQSAIARMLANPVYIGKLLARDDDGKRTVLIEGKHDAIVDDQLWARVQAITGGSRRTGGRHADGGHLLVRGVLRCTCGSAMIPRKARPGMERERYVCRGRIEHGAGFCAQPSIRRERIDEPLLATLLDGYIDFEATRRRIEERASSAGALAREALGQAEREAAAAETKLARVRGHYQQGRIEPEDWNEQRSQLTAELEAAQEAMLRAQEHVQQTEQGALPGDAEQALLAHLAELKKAVGEGIGSAPDLHALRNVIGELFESIRLVRSGRLPVGDLGDGFIPWHDDVPTVNDGKARYWLLLALRWSVVDTETFKPIGQEMPVGSALQYPPSDAKPFFARYCWW